MTADSDFGLPKAIAIIEIEEITQPTIDPLTLYCENDVWKRIRFKRRGALFVRSPAELGLRFDDAVR